MSDYLIIMSTTDSDEEARKLSRGAVENHLAACVQVSKISSTYWWEGKVEDSDEFLLMFKTVADRVDQLKDYLGSTHSYDTPEIIEVPIVGGGQSYLDWMITSTRS